LNSRTLASRRLIMEKTPPFAKEFRG